MMTAGIRMGLRRDGRAGSWIMAMVGSVIGVMVIMVMIMVMRLVMPFRPTRLAIAGYERIVRRIVAAVGPDRERGYAAVRTIMMAVMTTAVVIVARRFVVTVVVTRRINATVIMTRRINTTMVVTRLLRRASFIRRLDIGRRHTPAGIRFGMLALAVGFRNLAAVMDAAAAFRQPMMKRSVVAVVVVIVVTTLVIWVGYRRARRVTVV
jgi:hypothetical protein